MIKKQKNEINFYMIFKGGSKKEDPLFIFRWFLQNLVIKKRKNIKKQKNHLTKFCGGGYTKSEN